MKLKLSVDLGMGFYDARMKLEVRELKISIFTFTCAFGLLEKLLSIKFFVFCSVFTVSTKFVD